MPTHTPRPALLFGLILGLLLMAVMLLGLRQQRLVLTADLARTVSQIDAARLELWDTQAQLAAQTHPARLAATLQAKGLDLVPARPLALPASRYVQATHGPELFTSPPGAVQGTPTGETGWRVPQ